MLFLNSPHKKSSLLPDRGFVFGWTYTVSRVHNGSMDLTLGNFSDHIDPSVTARGEDYFKSGAVGSLKEHGPGEFVAIVSGTEEYRTRILLDGDDVLETSCSCPYDKGPVCKHVVAVLYALRNDRRGIGKTNDEGNAPVDVTDRKLEKMLREELIQLVKSARHGESVERIIKTAYADDGEWEDIRYVKGIVRESVDHASDSYGGISYGETFDAVDGARDVLDHAEEFESSRPRAAAICCMAVIEVLSPVLMNADDSDGDINGTISEAFELLARVTLWARDTNDHNLRKEILAHALGEWQKKKYEGWDCPEMFLEIVADSALGTGEEQSLETALIQYASPRPKEHAGDAKLDAMRSTGLWDNGGFNTHYRRERAATLQLRMLARLHPERVDDFLRAHIELYPMRKEAVERALSRGDVGAAKRLAHEGIEQAKKDKYPGHVSHFLDALMRCAEHEGDLKSAYEIAVRQFLDSHMEPFSYYRRAKRYAGAQWPERRSEIIAALEKGHGRFSGPHKLADLHVEEGMWNELLALVECNPELSPTYGKRLEKRFPKEIAHVYAKMVNKGMETPGGRDAYRAQCNVLRTIQTLGCPEVSQRIVLEWREKYPRRRALMEELDHL